MAFATNDLETPPSSIFVYSPRSMDNLKAPLSPTSSIKGVFVRSRPTSTVFSDYEYNEFPGIGDIGSPITSSEEEFSSSSSTSSPTTEDVLDATDRWARSQVPSVQIPTDARSLAPSTTFTISSRLRIVRRSDAQMHEEEVKLACEIHELSVQAEAESGKEAKVGRNKNKGKKELAEEEGSTPRRRTWPTYKGLRRTVSHILHRTAKDSSATTTRSALSKEAPFATRTTFEPEPVYPKEQIKSSSVSLFSRRRRRTNTDASVSSKKPPVQIPRRSATLDDIPLRPLRHSRSFSGRTNILGAIHDEEDADLDEATAEAKELVAEIRMRWQFEDVHEDDRECVDSLFERGVERAVHFHAI